MRSRRRARYRGSRRRQRDHLQSRGRPFAQYEPVGDVRESRGDISERQHAEYPKHCAGSDRRATSAHYAGCGNDGDSRHRSHHYDDEPRRLRDVAQHHVVGANELRRGDVEHHDRGIREPHHDVECSRCSGVRNVGLDDLVAASTGHRRLSHEWRRLHVRFGHGAGVAEPGAWSRQFVHYVRPRLRFRCIDRAKPLLRRRRHRSDEQQWCDMGGRDDARGGTGIFGDARSRHGQCVGRAERLWGTKLELAQHEQRHVEFRQSVRRTNDQDSFPHRYGFRRAYAGRSRLVHRFNRRIQCGEYAFPLHYAGPARMCALRGRHV